MFEVFDKKQLANELQPIKEKLTMIENYQTIRIINLENEVRMLKQVLSDLKASTIHVPPLADSRPFYDFIRRESMLDTSAETPYRLYYNGTVGCSS